jgi:hypothetical protein
MKTAGRLVFRGILLGVPLLAAVLWLVSGRQIFTQAERAVTIQVPDKLFGGMNTETHFVRGPIFGYYVGLDAVVVTTFVCVVIGGVSWLLRRRRERRKETL